MCSCVFTRENILSRAVEDACSHDSLKKHFSRTQKPRRMCLPSHLAITGAARPSTMWSPLQLFAERPSGYWCQVGGLYPEVGLLPARPVYFSAATTTRQRLPRDSKSSTCLLHTLGEVVRTGRGHLSCTIFFFHQRLRQLCVNNIKHGGGGSCFDTDTWSTHLFTYLSTYSLVNSCISGIPSVCPGLSVRVIKSFVKVVKKWWWVSWGGVNSFVVVTGGRSFKTVPQVETTFPHIRRVPFVLRSGW